METIDFEQLLLRARAARASDVLLTAGAPPAFRVDGVIRTEAGPRLTGEMTRTVVYGILSTAQIGRLENDRELDFSLEQGGHRYRCNAYWQAGTPAAAFRLIPDAIATPKDLGIPESIVNFVQRPQGLVLVTGASDQGKTTSQASLVDFLNRTGPRHIVTIEDPVEFVHRHQKSIVDQRELGSDTLSFAEALRHALRQSPDIILVGEMRDPDTIRAALVAAETGHLVMSTLHTNDACQALDRIIESFPEREQAQIRAQLSLSLLAVLAQRLVRGKDGRLLLAPEVLHNTHAVANLIRENKVYQIYSVLEAGQRQGMQTMTQALEGFVRRGLITDEEAHRYASVHDNVRPVRPTSGA